MEAYLVFGFFFLTNNKFVFLVFISIIIEFYLIYLFEKTLYFTLVGFYLPFVLWLY